MKYLTILYLAISLLNPARVNAQTFSSEGFKLESVSFGTENALYSTLDSIPPSISTEGPRAAAITETTVTISWKSDKPGSSIVFFGETTSYGNQQGNFTESVADHSVKIIGLAPNKTYHYKVRTRDSAGNNGDSADYTFSTKTTDITAPKMTGQPQVVVVQAKSATIDWTTDENASSRVKFSTDASLSLETGTTTATTTKHSVTLTGLTPKTTYQYQAVTKDGSGNETVAELASFTTTAEPGIQGVTISDVTLSSALLAWTTTVATTSVVDYGPTTSFTQQYKDTNQTTTHTVKLTDLVAGQRYYLQVAGADANNNTITSDTYLLDILPIPKVESVTVTVLSPNTVKMVIKANTDVDYLLEYQAVANSLTELADKQKKLQSRGDKILKSEHSFELNSLIGSTSYQYQVTVKDLYGNQAVSGVGTFTTLTDADRPVISEVKFDPSLEVSGNDRVQILVIWQTNEPTTSQVEYGEGASGLYTKKTTENTGLVLEHVVVIPNLNPDTTYHLRVVSRDLAGNLGVSADYLVLTPTKARSVTQLILERLENQLGWLTRIFK